MVYFVGMPLKRDIGIRLSILLAACSSISDAQVFKSLHDTGQSKADTTPVYKPHMKEGGRLTLTDSIVLYGYKFLGDQYHRGGAGAKGYDCSGYTMMLFRHFGI